ncbi:hypothetical protein JHK87_005022 [Glycine soja]|nr:hypothetical protein JHK87_005022 [Glycine soja]
MQKHDSPVGYVSDLKILFIVKVSSLISLAYSRSWSSASSSGVMEISLLKVLSDAISSFSHLSFSERMKSEPVSKYYQKAEKMLKLLKPIIDTTVFSDLASNKLLSKLFEELSLAVDELRELILNWHPLSSNFYFDLGLSILQQLKASPQSLLDNLRDETSSTIKKAIMEQLEGVGPSTEVLENIAENLGLRSNQEALIEAVALDKLKENAEQLENAVEVEFIDQMISVLVDPMKSKSLNQSSPFHGSMESGLIKDLPEIHQERTSTLHSSSTPSGSLNGMVNEQHVNLERISSTGSDDESASSDEGSVDSVDQSLMSPSTRESSNALSSEQSQTDVRTTSHNNTPLLSTSSVHSQDASGELNSGPDAVAMPTRRREPEFSPQLAVPRSRSQTLWQRSSEWLVPRVVSNPIETRADLSAAETQVRKLLEQLKSDSVDSKREATAELRLLAKENMDNRIVISNCGAISLIVDLLQSTDTRIQENSVTTLLNLSINDNNKAAIANSGAIEPLIHVLQTGSPEAKENSAATLFSLSVTEENKIRIGRSGAIRPLVDLLGNGTPRGKKDAATALFNLSLFHENKDRIVQAGAVKNLVELMDPAAGMVDKAVAVLANLATIPEGKTAIGQQGGIPVLVEVIELGSARGKENAAAALLHLCSDNHRYLNMVLQEGAVPPLVALSQSGTPRAKEKGSGYCLHP